MGRIPESIVDEIRERSDIVEVIASYVKLQKRGGDFWACCPFHKEKTPSFKVSSSRQSFYCFGCNKGGNVFTFLQEFANLDFPEAVRTLARRAGIVIPEEEADTPAAREAAARRRSEREQAMDLLQQMAQWFHHMLLSPEGRSARDYVQSRGLDEETVEQFSLGYAPEAWDACLNWAKKLGFSRELVVATGLAVVSSERPDHCYDRFRGRLIFPIHDAQGRVVGFSGRTMDPEAKGAKYVNTPETDYFHKGRILYGLHLARRHFRDHGAALVCEGQLDVIACHRAGLNHAVCAQGTAFTEHHARLLQRLSDEVILAFDADSAGRKAALKTIQLLHWAGVPARVVSLPAGADPDSLFREGGAEALREAMSHSVEAVHFVYQTACAEHDPESPQGKSDIVKAVMPAILSLDEPVARAAYCTWLAEAMGLPESAIRQSLQAAQRRDRQTRPDRSGSPSSAPEGTGPQPTGAMPGLPVFRMPDPREKALVALLDLALHYEAVARRLCDELPANAGDGGAVGKALQLVLALTMEDEWAEAGAAIAGDQELASVPEVARVLVATDYAGLNPDNAATDKHDAVLATLHRATEDCLRTLAAQELTERMAEARKALAANPTPEEASRLLKRISDLARQRHEIARPRDKDSET